MATIGSVALTYADWAKRMDDGYRVASIIELLSQTNEILDDMLEPDLRAALASAFGARFVHVGSTCAWW